MNPLFLGLCLWLGSASAAPQVDHVSIASRLVADGLWDRADTVLDEVSEPDDADAVRFYTLRGLVFLQLGDNPAALEALDLAVDTGEAEPLVQVYRAQALHGTEDPAAALHALDLAGQAAESLAGAWQLRARCQGELQQFDEAYDVLTAGVERFPAHAGLVEDRLALLVRLGLTRAVLDEGLPLLDRLTASEATYVGIGDQLRRAGSTDEAMAWLEGTRLRFPASVDARVALAGACLEAERPRCAGEQLQEAAAFDDTYATEAAECFRRAGDLDRALYLNGLVPDEATKVRQRLGLLLESQRFDQAIALDPRLRRLGITGVDQELTYALAYAHMRVGHPDRAEDLLVTLTEPRLFQQATALREAMATCAATGRGCD